MDKQSATKQLIQQNREFLDFTSAPSEEMLEEYNDTLIKLSSGSYVKRRCCFKTLGVDGIKQFGDIYVYDVADKLRALGLKAGSI